MSKRLSFFSILVLFVASLQVVYAGTSNQNLLERFFKQVRTYQANFEQAVLDAEGNVIQKSAGKLWINRPGKFHWQYTTPFAQKIIGDGKKVWIYDPELRQVTVKGYDKSVNQTPAVLLASNKKLSDSFLVSKQGTSKGITWLGLKPRGNQENFNDIRIGFKNKKLSVLELIDSFGQTTRITLMQTRENLALKKSLFRFKPPSGVDVVGQ